MKRSENQPNHRARETLQRLLEWLFACLALKHIARQRIGLATQSTLCQEACRMIHTFKGMRQGQQGQASQHQHGDVDRCCNQSKYTTTNKYINIPGSFWFVCCYVCVYLENTASKWMAVNVSSSLGVTPNQIVAPSNREGNRANVLFLDNFAHVESRFWDWSMSWKGLDLAAMPTTTSTFFHHNVIRRQQRSDLRCWRKVVAGIDVHINCLILTDHGLWRRKWKKREIQEGNPEMKYWLIFKQNEEVCS